jgi:hypothetical protein
VLSADFRMGMDENPIPLIPFPEAGKGKFIFGLRTQGVAALCPELRYYAPMGLLK